MILAHTSKLRWLQPHKDARYVSCQKEQHVQGPYPPALECNKSEGIGVARLYLLLQVPAGTLG